MSIHSSEDIAEQIMNNSPLSDWEDAYVSDSNTVILSFVQRYDGLEMSVEEFMTTLNAISEEVGASYVEATGIGLESVQIEFVFSEDSHIEN